MLARAVVMFWGPGEPGAMCLHRLRPGPLVRGVRDHTSHLMVPTCHLVSLCLLNAGWQAQGSQCPRHPKVHPSKGPVPCRDAHRSWSLVSHGDKAGAGAHICRRWPALSAADRQEAGLQATEGENTAWHCTLQSFFEEGAVSVEKHLYWNSCSSPRS